MLHQKKEKEFINNMMDRLEPEEVITETTGVEIQVNKEDQHFKPTPTEQGQMAMLIQL